MQKILFLIILVFIVMVIGVIFLPTPFSMPASWTPDSAPELSGLYAKNKKLLSSELLGTGEIYGPEDVAVDKAGIVYGGTQDGKIIRIHPDKTVEDWITTGGRPLGLHFDSNGNLIVRDAYLGLLSISPNAEMTVLVDEVEGVPLGFTDDLDIAVDGKIFFTDASYKWNQANYMMDLLEGRPYGRFIVYDPSTNEAEVLLKDLYFPNGVALSSSEEFVLINETWRYRILRYWLTGQNAGQKEIFIENLPGFPDGVSGNDQGVFWLAMPTPRIPIIDAAQSRPWLSMFLGKLPKSIQPAPVEYGFILGLNESAEVIHNLQDPTGEILKEITSVEEYAGDLYIGSLHNDRIGRYPLPTL
mgnify:FL=1